MPVGVKKKTVLHAHSNQGVPAPSAMQIERNKESSKRSMYRCRAADPERFRRHNRNSKRRARLQVLEFLGGECRICGFGDWRALQIDHINGGGYAEHKARGRSLDVYEFRAFMLEDPNGFRAKYQCLCANCNWIKRHTNNEHSK